MNRAVKNWPPEKIRAEFVLANVTQADIARRCGVTPTQVHRVVRGAVSDSVRREIARALGRDVRDIWPEYYLADSLVA